ncbi:MAG: hypothetical protein IPQ07_30765 [Myxococcales bacterium]|nr:hypothetical protein [Myxococcales bacterium]
MRFVRRPWLLAVGVGAVLVGSAAAYAPSAALRPVALALPAARPKMVMPDSYIAQDDVPALSIPKLVEAGQHWRLETSRGAVHVWTPHTYNPKTAITVVYVHGYFTDVDGAWRDHRLPEQFALSGINAMFIACDAPSDKYKPVAWPSLHGLLASVVAEIGVSMPQGRVVAMGHSGAFRTLEQWLPNQRLDTIVLLDAAYGDTWGYRNWLYAASDHRLIDVGDDTLKESDALHRMMPGTLVIDGFPNDELTDHERTARILYIRSQLGHMPLVTGGHAIPTLLRALRAPRILTAPIRTPLD